MGREVINLYNQNKKVLVVKGLKGLKGLKGFCMLVLLGVVHRAHFLHIHTSKHNNVIYKYIYLQGKTYTKTNLIYILYLKLQRSNIKQLVVIK